MERILFLDMETTGLKYKECFPTEIAFIITDKKGNVLKEYDSLIKIPEGEVVPEFITNLTGITTEQLNNKGKNIEDIYKDINKYFDENTLVVAHNASFDLGYLSYHLGINPTNFICTRLLWKEEDKNRSAKLEVIYSRYFGNVTQQHRALDDVYMLRDIYFKWKEVSSYREKDFYNRLKETPGRPLMFIPENAKVFI